MAQFQCIVCGASFQAKPGRKRRFCSKRCYGDAKILRVQRDCITCGSSFMARRDAVAKGEGNYCSRSCVGRDQVTDEVVRFESYAYGVGVEPAHVPGIGPCTHYTGTIGKDGYGVFALTGGKQTQAHIYAWILVNGLIPKGLCVCHHCDNRACIRIDHLFLDTKAGNNRDRYRKGREAKGATHKWSKLTDATVRDARLRYAAGGITQHELAVENNVSQPVMSAAIRGKTWRHVRSLI